MAPSKQRCESSEDIGSVADRSMFAQKDGYGDGRTTSNAFCVTMAPLLNSFNIRQRKTNFFIGEMVSRYQHFLSIKPIARRRLSADCVFRSNPATIPVDSGHHSGGFRPPRMGRSKVT